MLNLVHIPGTPKRRLGEYGERFLDALTPVAAPVSVPFNLVANYINSLGSATE